MIETINGKAYVKKGDKVYEVGGGGTNFIFANSKEELPDPSTVPENTVAFVPSEGGGGLPVVELTTRATGDGAELTADEAAEMNALNGGVCILDMYLANDAGEMHFKFVPAVADMQGMFQYSAYLNGYTVTITNMTGSWTLSVNF